MLQTEGMVDGVVEMFERLWIDEGLSTAARYLDLQRKLDSGTHAMRSLQFVGEKIQRKEWAHKMRLEKQLLTDAVLAMLSPSQTPMTPYEIQLKIEADTALVVDYIRIRRVCNGLADLDLLKVVKNPFKPQQNAYCSYEFTSDPQVGDRVLELVRTRSRQVGTVQRFKFHQMAKANMPVVNWDNGQVTFANPDHIIILERAI